MLLERLPFLVLFSKITIHLKTSAKSAIFITSTQQHLLFEHNNSNENITALSPATAIFVGKTLRRDYLRQLFFENCSFNFYFSLVCLSFFMMKVVPADAVQITWIYSIFTFLAIFKQVHTVFS